jgi:glycerophosphoryl diester phosphodiesterase
MLRVTLLLLLCGLWASANAFDVQGHRGARGLAPENTLAAFGTALDLGVSTLELDVGLTRDGHVVVAHDRRLNPDITRDAQGRWLAQPGPPLHQLSLAELQRFDVGRINPTSRYAQNYAEQTARDGERIPTLAALFELVKKRGNSQVRFNIETKLTPLAADETAAPEVMVRALLAVVRQHGVQQRVSVQSFDWRSLKLVQQLAPEIPTVALTARQSFLDNVTSGEWTAGLRLQDHGGSLPRLVQASGAKVWSPFHGDLTPALLAEAQALGLKVLPWTVNAPEAIERFIDMKVDGLISDHPDRVLKALAQRGMPAQR